MAHLEAHRGPILTEVSGGVTLDTVGAYAAAGTDLISVGALTHSAPRSTSGSTWSGPTGAGCSGSGNGRTPEGG